MPYHLHPHTREIRVDTYDELKELLSNGLLTNGVAGAFGDPPANDAPTEAEVDAMIRDETSPPPSTAAKLKHGLAEHWRLAKAYQARKKCSLSEARTAVKLRYQGRRGNPAKAK